MFALVYFGMGMAMIAALAALAGTWVARARMTRLLAVTESPGVVRLAANEPPPARSAMRRRMSARHEYDLMIGRTFFR